MVIDQNIIGVNGFLLGCYYGLPNDLLSVREALSITLSSLLPVGESTLSPGYRETQIMRIIAHVKFRDSERTKSMTDLDLIKQNLTRRWSTRSPRDIANKFSGPLYGSAGEWDLPADITPKRDLLYLAIGIPDADSLPKTALDAASRRAHAKPGDLALRYGFGKGPSALRQWLAEHRNKLEGTHVTADWFQMTNGSSGAIDLIVRSMIDPGDVIISETPTYMGTLHNFQGVGADIRYVPMDRHGLRTDSLDSLLSQLREEGKKVKLIYTISAFHNPSSVTSTLERRLELLELAYKHDVMILDDEAYRELWYDTPPPRAISALSDGYGVITTGTFSKTVATGIRVGWIHARPELLALFARMRFAMGQNQLGLRAFSEFLTAGEYEPHLTHIRRVYARKRDAIHRALSREVKDYMEWDLPEGGFYIWAKLKGGLQAEPLWRTAVSEGIAVNPSTGFSPGEAYSEPCIRIAYPWTPIDEFDEAARRLRIACERVASGDAA
jgi:2-aminoadipate transaminase